jgi:hypothetical protein
MRKTFFVFIVLLLVAGGLLYARQQRREQVPADARAAQQQRSDVLAEARQASSALATAGKAVRFLGIDQGCRAVSAAAYSVWAARAQDALDSWIRANALLPDDPEVKQGSADAVKLTKAVTDRGFACLAQRKALVARAAVED